jgi:hypothetical protein
VRKVYLALSAAFILIALVSAKGQEQQSQNFFLETAYHYGFLWQHRPTLADIAGGNIHTFQMAFSQKTFGKQYWDKLYRYPDKGIGYTYVYLGNPDELGHAQAFYGFVRIPLIRKYRFTLSYKISGGLAYLEQKNTAIGTNLNVYFDASMDTKWQLTDKIDLIQAFGATHFSNGAVKMPNLGINFFAYRMGIVYKLQTPLRTIVHSDLPVLEKRNSFSVAISAGIKQKKPDGNTNHPIGSISAGYLYQISHQHKTGVGIDVFYDSSLYEVMDPDSTLGLRTKDIMRYGAHMAFEARIYRIMLGIHIGTYLWANYRGDGSIYQRVSLKYLLSEKWFTSISLKTSKGVADFIEWGIGHRFSFGH